ncbi:MAG TPA: single-stranded DNA-binding protein, partial [Candidatus Sulfotelmatobacter sp.]|nr:single-stranded DNA-binding protein [Candidatus Sulfotelmatobacter sp.]
ELRYTPSGSAVCSFSIATNRSWTTDTGEKKDEVEFHRIVAWNKLAELCSQFLTKGRKVFVEGRLQTRQWNAQDGTQKQTTEIVISDMILLDSRKQGESQESEASSEDFEEAPKKAVSKKEVVKEEEPSEEAPADEEIQPDDIPF